MKRFTSAKARTKKTDVLIVGGGLSGLMVAHQLEQIHADWKLVEARHILGGRIANDTDGDEIDLGGTWIWPKFQPQMASLVHTLSVSTFRQPDDPSSARIRGGAIQLVHRLADALPASKIELKTPVISVTQQQKTSKAGVLVRVETADAKIYLARNVVFAIPPKLVSERIQFDPPLSESKTRAMQKSQTWMAGVTKVALVYRQQFWQNHSNMGLGGKPAFQVYDASTDKVSALTFFALAISDDDKELATQVAKQMARAWKFLGKPDMARRAQTFVKFHVQRWPKEKYISDDVNPTQINPHPQPVPELSKNEWGGALLFGGSETDEESPGIMEGAVGAALRVVEDLESMLAK